MASPACVAVASLFKLVVGGMEKFGLSGISFLSVALQVRSGILITDCFHDGQEPCLN